MSGVSDLAKCFRAIFSKRLRADLAIRNDKAVHTLRCAMRPLLLHLAMCPRCCATSMDCSWA